MEKSNLRKKYLFQRQQLALKEVSSMSNIIYDKVINTQGYKGAKSIFTYVSVKNEVDTIFLILKALDDQKKVAVPKVFNNGIMKFYNISSIEELKTSKFGLLEPSNTTNEAIPNETTLFLIPGVIFDYSCNRIGFGAGYYDQYLKRFPGSRTIGLAFEEQVLKSIPYNDYDVPMEYVITEKNMYVND